MDIETPSAPVGPQLGAEPLLPSERKTTTKKAGLILSVSRTRRVMFDTYGKGLRIGADTPVVMAAATEYLLGEILELATQRAEEDRKKQLTPRHVQDAINRDLELKPLFGDHSTLRDAGDNPGIHPNLIRGCRNKYPASADLRNMSDTKRRK